MVTNPHQHSNLSTHQDAQSVWTEGRVKQCVHPHECEFAYMGQRSVNSTDKGDARHPTMEVSDREVLVIVISCK